ncbi:MAG: lipoate--protein ligase family protein [Candidatus Krumholzibacteria bacterium]|jgi:lipoate-protein ligase A|nr:lipoate--protein ligase family protein [Candidatus Krumholzibacteria bacterium]MDP6668719.1 lipoate--protein ligase family protein [Candidatus Krumholzibacteria bacterium]MDP6797730.1 lipoate--protein ligase family protein [Candidatus Krumholzibacteria bacterium]MDP7021181.1 lipoate--protein ligase family protein [Candidatus Krumholzibacteria bacterium]
MRRDREAWEALESGSDHSLLRIYGWSPWTVSLGRHQNPEKSLDFEELSRRGYGWVRRPSGGRAVFHAEELTYCLAAPLEDIFEGSIAESHHRISQALLRFYRKLGLSPRLSNPAPARELDPQLPDPCFLAPGLSELELEGKKMAGSAQFRGKRAFLQHGSLPIGPAHLDLADLMPGDPASRKETRRQLNSRSACLSLHLDRVPSRQRLAESLMDAFCEEFQIKAPEIQDFR